MRSLLIQALGGTIRAVAKAEKEAELSLLNSAEKALKKQTRKVRKLKKEIEESIPLDHESLEED